MEDTMKTILFFIGLIFLTTACNVVLANDSDHERLCKNLLEDQAMVLKNKPKDCNAETRETKTEECQYSLGVIKTVNDSVAAFKCKNTDKPNQSNPATANSGGEITW